MPARDDWAQYFDVNARRSVFDIKEDYAVVTTAYDKRVVPFSSTRPQDKKLLKLMTTFVKESFFYMA